MLKSVYWMALALSLAMLVACESEEVASPTENQPAPSAAEVAPAAVDEAPVIEPESMKEDAVDPAIQPALWKIEDQDSRLYLFGTVHLLPPDLVWASEAYQAAMLDAPVTVTEANVDDPEVAGKIAALTLQLGANPPGVKLSDVLGEERYERFAKIVGELGLPAESMQPFKPWLATITASVMAIQAQGFDPNSGVDRRITAQALEEGDELAYLETAESQIRMLASLNEEEMLANFDVTLEQIADPDAMLNPLIKAWQQGDMEALERIAIDDLRSTSPEAFEKLLVQRNTNWADQVQEMLSGSGNYFIAVGAMHLAGEGSLIDILNDRGVEADRMQ